MKDSEAPRAKNLSVTPQSEHKLFGKDELGATRQLTIILLI